MGRIINIVTKKLTTGWLEARLGDNKILIEQPINNIENYTYCSNKHELMLDNTAKDGFFIIVNKRNIVSVNEDIAILDESHGELLIYVGTSGIIKLTDNKFIIGTENKLYSVGLQLASAIISKDKIVLTDKLNYSKGNLYQKVTKICR